MIEVNTPVTINAAGHRVTGLKIGTLGIIVGLPDTQSGNLWFGYFRVHIPAAAIDPGTRSGMWYLARAEFDIVPT